MDSTLEEKKHITEVADLLTPFPEVIEELERRQHDPELRKRVEEYLKNDIPEYFLKEPVLYLARHVATPNFETLRFLHLTDSLNMPIVIGQDTKDIMVAHNPLKKDLGKLPICTGSKMKEGHLNEQYQYCTVIDFNTSVGKSFSDIRTVWGDPLVDFHTELFGHLTKHKVNIVDDWEWIDRNHRGNLLKHYHYFLALFIVHGVLFEDYLVEDVEEGEFIKNVLRPAFEHVESKLGIRPLITYLNSPSIESPIFWQSYPHTALDFIKDKMGYSKGT
ncbi:hypothetical protein KKH15_01160 [Patescibacteria group bacterium]|nr:hypothetical protein [Patescibacteria group bacterium]MBU1754932.1 hypothetical protein [Patescibacteria group bacterium]